MDREQLIRALRKIQDDEFMKFGNVGDRTHGRAADMLEADEIVFHSYESALQLARNESALLRRKHSYRLVVLAALNLLSHLILATLITYALINAKVWTWPLF